MPPYGACLLGSFNTVKYVDNKRFNFDQFISDIYPVVRGMDNIIDRTNYPLSEQETEAKNKRRMGLGVTGIANASEACGYQYGSEQYLKFQAKVLKTLRDHTYRASIELSKKRGHSLCSIEISIYKVDSLRLYPRIFETIFMNMEFETLI